MNPNKISSEILAPGRSITLVNGNTITIRYGFNALGILEDEFGSVDGLFKALADGAKGRLFKSLAVALWAGTSRQLTKEAFADLLDPTQLAAYSEAMNGALAQAFGSRDEESTEGEAPAEAETSATA